MSANGTKETFGFLAITSAFDPKRTSDAQARRRYGNGGERSFAYWGSPPKEAVVIRLPNATQP
jgi:hypothetical protein